MVLNTQCYLYLWPTIWFHAKKSLETLKRRKSPILLCKFGSLGQKSWKITVCSAHGNANYSFLFDNICYILGSINGKSSSRAFRICMGLVDFDDFDPLRKVQSWPSFREKNWPCAVLQKIIRPQFWRKGFHIESTLSWYLRNVSDSMVIHKLKIIFFKVYCWRIVYNISISEYRVVPIPRPFWTRKEA